MKSIIKKYSKRIIITALLILLIAVVGTVNNYRTYNIAQYTYKEWMNGHFVTHIVDESVMKRLSEFYPEEELAVKSDGVYYKNIKLHPKIGPENWHVDISLDAEEYRYDDTVTVTVENANAEYVELYNGAYILRWNGYSLHTDSLDDKSEENLVRLEKGESISFEIPLEYISEFKEGPIKLKKGTYSISVYAANCSVRTGYVSHNWYSCEFKVK